MSMSQDNEPREKDIYVCFRLKEMREMKGLSQIEVAEYLDVNVKTVGRWEREIPIPSDKLLKLSELGIDIIYVLTGEFTSVYQATRRIADLNTVIEPPGKYNVASSDDLRAAEVAEKFRDLEEAEKQAIEATLTAFSIKK